MARSLRTLALTLAFVLAFTACVPSPARDAHRARLGESAASNALPTGMAEAKARAARDLRAWAARGPGASKNQSSTLLVPAVELDAAAALQIVPTNLAPAPAEALSASISTECGDFCFVVTFNKPMVMPPWATASVPAFSFDPPLDGAWQWFDARTLRWKTHEAQHARTFALTIPRGITALDGSQLAEPIRFVWNSPGLALTFFFEPYGQDPLQTIEAHFSMPVDAATARQNFTLGVDGVPWPFDVSVDENEVTLSLTRPAPPGSTVVATALPGLATTEGPRPLGKAETYRVEIAAKRPAGFYCTKLLEADGDVEVDEAAEPEMLASGQSPARGRCDPSQGLSLELPPTFEHIEQFLQLEPAVDNLTTYYGLNGDFEPGVTYRVTLAPRNSRGQVLTATDGTVFTQTLTGTFTFGGWPIADWANGRVVRAAELDSVLPIAVRNVREIETRSRRLDERQLFEHLLGGTTTLPRFANLIRHPSPTAERQELLTRSVSALIGARTPGVYELELRSRQRSGKKRVERRLLNVSDWLLSTLTSETTIELRAERSSGEPVAGVEVSARALRKDSQTVRTKTGPDGTAHLALSALRQHDEQYLVVLRDAAEFAYAVVDVPSSTRETALLFTDRGLYRAGESVQLKGIVQRRTAPGLRPVVDGKYWVVVRAQGGSIVEREVLTSQYGSFSLAVALAKDLPRVDYAVELRASDAADARVLARARFIVGDYEPDVFEVDAKYNAEEAITGQALNCVISARGLHGGPLRGAPVTVTLSSSEDTNVPEPPPEGYTVGVRYADLGKTLSFDTHLDQQGRLVVAHTAMLRGKDYPQRAYCRADVEGPHAQVRTANARAHVLPRAFVAFKENTLGSAGELHGKIQLLDAQGRQRALRGNEQVRLRAALVEDRQWDTELPLWQSFGPLTANPLPVAVKLPAHGPQSGNVVLQVAIEDNEQPLAWGEFEVYVNPAPSPAPSTAEAKRVEAQGGEHRQQTFQHGSSGPAPASLTLSSESTHEGQSVAVEIHDPTLKQAAGVLHVVGAGVIATHAFQLADHRAHVPLQIDAAMVPEVVLWASIGGVAQRRTANAYLRVDDKGRALDLSVTPSLATTKPGATTKIEVRTLHQGKPVSAEVTLYVVDEGSLRMTRYEVPDPIAALYDLSAPSYFDSNTAAERVDFGWLPHGSHHTRPPTLRMGSTTTTHAPYRSNFTQTPLFVASLITDRQGHAIQELTLPDSLTEYRLMAVAATKSGEFGHAQASVRTAQPLMLQPSIPRSVWVGDSVLPTVAITSLHDRPLLVATHLQWLLEGSVSAEEVRLTRIPAGGLEHVSVPWFANAAGRAHLRVSASAYDERQLLAVYNHAPSSAEVETWARGRGPVPSLFQDAVSVESEVHEAVQEHVAQLTGEMDTRHTLDLRGIGAPVPGPSEAGLSLSLSNSPLATLGPALRGLLEYPHGCTEQLSSRILPHTSIPALLGALGLQREELEGATGNALLSNAELEPLLQRVLANQQELGGFGLWEHSEMEPALSAYVAVVLSQARRAGLSVPKGSLRALRKYLYAEAQRLLAEDPNFEPDPSWTSDPRTASLLLFGAAQLPADESAAPRSEADAQPSWAELQRGLDAQEQQLPAAWLALWASAATDERSLRARQRRAARIVAGLRASNGALVAETPASGDAFTTQTHATAFALLGLAKIAPRHPQLFALVKGLLQLREQGSWGSTQETAWALLALQAYAEAHPEAAKQLRAQVTLGGTPLLDSLLRPGQPVDAFVPMELLASHNDEVTLLAKPADAKSGLGAKAYYSARVNTWRRGFAPALEHGLKLDVQFDSETKFEHGAQLAVGALGFFSVTLDSSVPRRFLVVEVPLPAGVRGVTSTMYGMSPEYFGHYDLREDRALFYLDRVSAGRTSFTFTVLGEHAGRFQVAPAQVYEMYDESVRARTSPRWFSVAPPGFALVPKAVTRVAPPKSAARQR